MNEFVLTLDYNRVILFKKMCGTTQWIEFNSEPLDVNTWIVDPPSSVLVRGTYIASVKKFERIFASLINQYPVTIEYTTIFQDLSLIKISHLIIGNTIPEFSMDYRDTLSNLTVTSNRQPFNSTSSFNQI
jgi:hypothetical protein